MYGVISELRGKEEPERTFFSYAFKSAAHWQHIMIRWYQMGIK